LRFEPSGAAHDANLRGVELRVNRSSATYGSSAESTSAGTGVLGGGAAAVPTASPEPTPVT